MRMKGEMDYQAEMDMHTMKAAEEIEANPKRIAAAKNAARRKIAEMKAFLGEETEEERTMRQGYSKIG